MLRFEQKWLSLNTPQPSGSLKRKTGEPGSQASVGDHETRPEGSKAAKAKRSSCKGRDLDEVKTIWEFKKEDLEMKEKLSKLAILDTLLTREQPLSDAEEVVKNKLLALYF